MGNNRSAVCLAPRESVYVYQQHKESVPQERFHRKRLFLRHGDQIKYIKKFGLLYNPYYFGLSLPYDSKELSKAFLRLLEGH